MSMLDPFEFDPDDERLSRYLDDDLSVDERAELERELTVRPDLQARLADLREVTGWVATAPVELSAVDAEALLGSALAAFDASQREGATTDNPSSVVVPMAPRRRPNRRWSPNLIGLSAAALLLIVAVAALARGASSSDDTADSGETAALAFEPERGVAEALSTKAGAAADSAANLESVPAAALADAPLADLGPFTDEDSLVAAIVGLGSFSTSSNGGQTITTAATATSTAPPTTTAPSTAAPSVASSTTASATSGCRPDIAGSASIDGRAVRWAVLGTGTAGDPRRVTVIDALSCAVLVERPI